MVQLEKTKGGEMEVAMDKNYLTAIQALNHHHYDWHKTSVDRTRRYPTGVRSWTDWGIEENIANPIRAYLDYLYYNIRFQERVPNMTIEMFLFDEKEKHEIETKIETLLRPVLTDKERELLGMFEKYSKGAKYDIRSKSYAQRKARRESLRSH